MNALLYARENCLIFPWNSLGFSKPPLNRLSLLCCSFGPYTDNKIVNSMPSKVLTSEIYNLNVWTVAILNSHLFSIKPSCTIALLHVYLMKIILPAEAVTSCQ